MEEWENRIKWGRDEANWGPGVKVEARKSRERRRDGGRVKEFVGS